ncbi:MAG: hypothetical protein WDO14_16680 [Bacteroidota bacterium]
MYRRRLPKIFSNADFFRSIQYLCRCEIHEVDARDQYIAKAVMPNVPHVLFTE